MGDGCIDTATAEFAVGCSLGRVGQVFAAHRKPPVTELDAHQSHDRADQNGGPIPVGREYLAHPTWLSRFCPRVTLGNSETNGEFGPRRWKNRPNCD